MRRCLIVLIATVGLLTGCGTAPSSVSADALQFTATTLDGREFSGEGLQGRPAVLWFWAPWCSACQQEAPGVARVAAANPEVTFVGVGARGKLPALQSFVTKYGLDKTTELADTDAAVWKKFGVTRQPAFAFVRPDGSIDVVQGTLAEDSLSARVKALTDR